MIVTICVYISAKDTYKTQECVEVIKKLIKVENQDDIDNILMTDSCGQWCG